MFWTVIEIICVLSCLITLVTFIVSDKCCQDNQFYLLNPYVDSQIKCCFNYYHIKACMIEASLAQNLILYIFISFTRLHVDYAIIIDEK